MYYDNNIPQNQYSTTLDEIKRGINEAMEEFNLGYNPEKYHLCFNMVITAICESSARIRNPRKYAKGVSLNTLKDLNSNYNHCYDYDRYRI